MPINVIGVAGALDVTGFSRLMQRQGDAKASMAVPEGLAVTPAAGTRTVSVSAGEALQAGTLAVMDAAATVTLAANTSGVPRIDTVCMQVDWTKPSSTSGTLMVRQGTPAATPVPAALTQNRGVLWQTPLSQVQVAPGATATTAADITDVRPGSVAQSSQTPSGGVYYRSGAGFSQTFQREAAVAGFKDISINRSGTPNTASYGVYKGFGGVSAYSDGMISAGSNRLLAPVAGLYSLSTYIEYGPVSVTGKVALRFFATGKPVHGTMAQKIEERFEDHLGDTQGISLDWTGWLPAGASPQVLINPYTSANIDVNFFELTWARFADLAGDRTI